MRRSGLLLTLCCVGLLSGCESRSPVAPPEPPPPAVADQCVSGAMAGAPTTPELHLDPIFAAAAAEFQVPEPLLKAIGYVETRWQMVRGEAELGRDPAYGVMGLRGAALRRGAALAGVSDDAARAEPAANIRAAAALLRSYADDMGARPVGIGGWAPAVARYSGIALPEGAASYVNDAVYATLRRGARSTGGDGRGIATLEPVRVEPAVPARFRTLPLPSLSAPDFAGAVWRPSPNFNQRENGEITMVIIHTCEGGYTGCWSWLVSQQSGVSAHYVINEEGSEISQLVEEQGRAWHIGARYNCANNVGLDCWRNGQQSNHFTVGIEHAGFASQISWPSTQIETSARLVCDIARRRRIPIDHLHIAAHGQLQPENRTDPGPHWPWADYVSRIRRICGTGSADGPILVVDNGAGNDPARATFAGTGWTVTSATRGYFGVDYAFAAATAGEPATFSFYNPRAGTRTVGAWWTSGTNRSPRTPFVALGPDGREVGRAEVSQRTAGSRWNTLGSWDFPAGWNRIQVARGSAAGCVVIADAVLVN